MMRPHASSADIVITIVLESHMRIVQIVPFIGPGSGVAGVAWNLDRELRKLGVTVENLTYPMTVAGRSGIRVRGWRTARIAQVQRILSFSTNGTRFADRYLADRPDAVSICHNDVMTGDIYVNHGVLYAAMKARGNSWLRYLRDPTHIYTHLRDRRRYRGTFHSVVVALTDAEAETLRATYGTVRPRIEVISNGVDLQKFRPPTAEERAAARSRFNLGDEDRVALFIGHEFDRKGLPVTIAALAQAPTVLLLVVGGNERLLHDARALAERHGVGERVLFAGEQGDISAFLAASDMFVMPSVYESSGLVYLEALASGLPVIATAVGVAAETVRDGHNGYLVPRDASTIADRLESIAAAEPGAWRANARESVLRYSWESVARRYLALAERVAAERDGAAAWNEPETGGDS
jgi:UDP-glucose:(heptosyl)LPS alpha-1,3-glucosyltransferase